MKVSFLIFHSILIVELTLKVSLIFSIYSKKIFFLTINAPSWFGFFDFVSDWLGDVWRDDMNVKFTNQNQCLHYNTSLRCSIQEIYQQIFTLKKTPFSIKRWYVYSTVFELSYNQLGYIGNLPCIVVCKSSSKSMKICSLYFYIILWSRRLYEN